jgi:hypothetical protein
MATKLKQPKGKIACVSCEIKSISKGEAKRILERLAPHQRSIKSWSKARIVHDMSEGNWWFTGSPIVFDEDGFLIDGQHRINSFIESTLDECAFLFVDGVCREAYVAIDGGVGKSTGDYFKFNEIPNANAAAATARWLLRYDNSKEGQIFHQSLISRTMTEQAYLKRADAIQQAITYSKDLGSFLGSVSMAAAIFVLVSEAYGQEFGVEFFRHIETGIGHGAAQKLHKAINTDNKKARKSITPDARFASVLEAARSTYVNSPRRLIKPAIQSLNKLA